MPKTSTTSKHRLPLVFGVVGIILVLQFLFSRLVQEPYPAVILPGFGLPMPMTDSLHYTEYQVQVYFTQGDSMELPLQQVFPNIRNSHAKYAVKALLEAPQKGTLDKSALVDLQTYLAQILPSATHRKDVKVMRIKAIEVTQHPPSNYTKRTVVHTRYYSI